DTGGERRLRLRQVAADARLCGLAQPREQPSQVGPQRAAVRYAGRVGLVRFVGLVGLVGLAALAALVGLVAPVLDVFRLRLARGGVACACVRGRAGEQSWKQED